MLGRIIYLSISLLLITAPVLACEPCNEVSNLDRTIKKTQYIILLGQKISESDFSNYGPDWIEIKVDHVLKGNIVQDKIKFAGWYGMCGYGFTDVEYGKSYLMFLTKEPEDPIYEAVDWGCAVRHL